jgi:hypothetical protein
MYVSLSEVSFSATADTNAKALEVAVKVPRLARLRMWELIDRPLRDLDSSHI